jgi:prefoldin subunit 5
MQQNTQRRAAGLKDKIPDIQKTLETVRFLKSRKDDAEPLETTFELNDTLYAKAEVPPTDEVYLWLGANVMLAYPIPEAEELLQSKLSTARHSLSTCEEDLDFLREQITVRALFFLSTAFNELACLTSMQTLEVAFARVYNWDVAQRRKDREAGESIEDKKRGSPNG